MKINKKYININGILVKTNCAPNYFELQTNRLGFDFSEHLDNCENEDLVLILILSQTFETIFSFIILLLY